MNSYNPYTQLAISKYNWAHEEAIIQYLKAAPTATAYASYINARNAAMNGLMTTLYNQPNPSPVPDIWLMVEPVAFGAGAAATMMHAEGPSGTTFKFLVTRSGDVSGETSVEYNVIGSWFTPADAADFGGTLPSGTIKFLPGETQKTIGINVSGDTDVEPSEVFSVVLSKATGGAVITTDRAANTILNDDAQAQKF